VLTTLLQVNQSSTNPFATPGLVSVAVSFTVVVGLYASVAVLVRRRMGPVALWLLALVQAFLVARTVWPKLPMYPTGYEHYLLIWVLIGAVAAFAVAPTATIWMAARRPSPPSYWKQVGLGVASTIVAVLVFWLISFLVNTFGFRVLGWSR
jgi:uncharacterized membrane protein YeaQ/YmgE (transglycosylase-associated protein family)